jgi:hypothetical protein
LVLQVELSSVTFVSAAVQNEGLQKMSVTFETSDPTKLLNTFRKAITDGHVRTWECDKDGDFTHKTDQWVGRAWLHPDPGIGTLTMTFIPPQNTRVSNDVFAIYQGRFIESVTAHCNQLFQRAISTARPTNSDNMVGSGAA